MKIGVTVYIKIMENVRETVERAFYKAVLLYLSNFIEGAVYGVSVDLPDAPCYSSSGDGAVIEAVERCFFALPDRYRRVFFAVVRARRYNIKNIRENAFACENGTRGARENLICGRNEYALSLGRVPNGLDLLYFSASEGLLEAEGLRRLIKITEKEGKNAFPMIRSENPFCEINESLNNESRSAKYRKRVKNGCFSMAEGLFTDKTVRKSENTDGDGKDGNKNVNIPVKSVFVYGLSYDKDIKKMGIDRKETHRSFAYRAAVASSRVFFRAVDNGFVSISSVLEAAETLLALSAMHVFGFIGKEELISGAHVLLDMMGAENEACDLGRVIFLITVTLGTYESFSVKDADLIPLKECAEKLICKLESEMRTKNAESNNEYLILCYKNTRIDFDEPCCIPRLMKAVFSESISYLTENAVCDFENTEDALCVLISSVNVCFAENIKTDACRIPIIKARASLLLKDPSLEKWH